MPKVYLETYGCAANKNDSEIMLALLKNANFEIVDNPKNADVNIINTCVVKQATASRMISRIRFLSSLKKPLIVAGCMAKAEKERIEKLNPNASIISPNSIDKIVEVTIDTLRGIKRVELNGNANKAKLPSIRFNPIIEIIQIASGCLSFCTFCETKLAKGNLTSYRISDIKEKVINAVKNGAKEIWITSQDNSAYGRDIGVTLIDLLESLIEIEGKFWIRVGMMNPLHFKKLEVEKLAELFNDEKIFKFLHVPVQSGSNEVLKHMRRGYTIEEFMDWVNIFRRKVKNITIATDIIVGYPTETEKDFEQTIELLKNLRPDVVNLSKFSPRPNTYAATLKQLHSKIVDERSKILHSLIREISLENNKKWKDWKGVALVDEKVDNGFIARNIYYKPIFLKNAEFGKFVEVKVKEVYSNFLLGEVEKSLEILSANSIGQGYS
ncbi:MAG: tRNA (N(6)-L-threonylcarbamoyladenosine(37)-C(2))-methylthiotransferase [Candidatus Aenigmatarchaeota archaeon]